MYNSKYSMFSVHMSYNMTTILQNHKNKYLPVCRIKAKTKFQDKTIILKNCTIFDGELEPNETNNYILVYFLYIFDRVVNKRYSSVSLNKFEIP